MMVWSVILATAGAGAAGAVCRLLLSELVRHWFGAFPFSTLAVNVLGCFLFGLLWQISHGRWSPLVETTVLVGFLGAFTTFSAFAFDCQQLLEQQRWTAFAANIALQNVLGLAAVILGIWIGTGARAPA